MFFVSRNQTRLRTKHHCGLLIARNDGAVVGELAAGLGWITACLARLESIGLPGGLPQD